MKLLRKLLLVCSVLLVLPLLPFESSDFESAKGETGTRLTIGISASPWFVYENTPNGFSQRVVIGWSLACGVGALVCFSLFRRLGRKRGEGVGPVTA